MPTILPAPNAAPRMPRTPLLPAPVAAPKALRYIVVPGYAAPATLFRLITMKSGAAMFQTRGPTARPLGGVIVPRAFAGSRFEAGVLIPRRARRAALSYPPRFFGLKSGQPFRLKNGEPLQLLERDNG